MFYEKSLSNFKELVFFTSIRSLDDVPEQNKQHRKNFTRIDIPENVIRLGRYTLGFDHPVTVIFHGKTPPFLHWAFSYTTQTFDTCTTSGCKFYVPDESLEAYKEAFTTTHAPLKNASIIHPISEYQP